MQRRTLALGVHDSSAVSMGRPIPAIKLVEGNSNGDAYVKCHLISRLRHFSQTL
jgi:hypothetical protein